MPKMTIYVSDDLKAAMDKVEDQKPNWSGLAQVAFQSETERLSIRKRSAGKMDAVIERLRASRERTNDAQRHAGYEAGRRWAMEDAEFWQLEKMNASDAKASFNSVELLADEIAAEVLGYPAGPGRDFTDITIRAAEFWRGVAHTGKPARSFAEEFVRGALEVYEEVKDKL